MTTLAMDKRVAAPSTSLIVKIKRVESIDLLRGIVMIIMALDHVRDYFHRDAFFYSPTDLTQTTSLLFFTRFITHYCAPVFVFLAGISAYLHGAKKSKIELAGYLFRRGVWLVAVELFIVSLAWTFNPTYPILNLQVIWAIGISMIVLSALVFLKRGTILAVAIVLIAGHNLLDKVHLPGVGITSFLWSFLHKPADFVVGHFTFIVRYPVLPWIGIMAIGYCFGPMYESHYNAAKRRKVLLSIGVAAIGVFFLLRSFNIYGDAAHWSSQKSFAFSLMSLLNVTKYPPSLLYILITLGPAMIFLAGAEKPLNKVTEKVVVFGRVPFFYYVIHIYLIHLLAVIGAAVTGYGWPAMILNNRVNTAPGLKGYGFNLPVVYIVWVMVILILYPACKWFAAYKRGHQANYRWLQYL